MCQSTDRKDQLTAVAFFFAAGRRKHFWAQRSGHLDGGYPDTTAAAVYKETFTWLEPGAIDGAGPGFFNAFNAADSVNNKSIFLIGIAYMEVKQYGNAIQSFTNILNNNSQTGDDYFNDDAEYYLALSYLANKQVPEAIELIKKIKADKTHLYNSKAAEISATDLSIIEYKNN